MERGFDKLMTPAGIGLVTAAMFLFFVIIAGGGVVWSLMERVKREKKAATPADLDPEENTRL